MKDIAQRTGVSIATVSNVLNRKSGAAAPAKAAEILAVAEQLQYHPNSLARNLKLRQTNSLGIITEDLTVFNTPEIVDGIESYCDAHGYEILLVNMRLYKRYGNDFTNTPEHAKSFRRALTALLSKQVVGIVYIGYHSRRVDYTPGSSTVPFVYAYCYPPAGAQYSYVMTDDEQAGYDVGCFLLKNGHRKIGILSGPLTNQTALNRLHGYRRALAEHGVPYNAAATVFGDWSRESGCRCAEALTSMGLSAIFAFNDEMASGVYFYCNRNGIRIGRDLSLYGFDNLAPAAAFDPPISSVAPPLEEIGRKSAELALSQIEKPLAPQSVLLPAALCARPSVVNLNG